MDTQEYAICFSKTNWSQQAVFYWFTSTHGRCLDPFYSYLLIPEERRKTFGLSWNQTQVLLLHKQPLTTRPWFPRVTQSIDDSRLFPQKKFLRACLRQCWCCTTTCRPSATTKSSSKSASFDFAKNGSISQLKFILYRSTQGNIWAEKRVLEWKRYILIK